MEWLVAVVFVVAMGGLLFSVWEIAFHDKAENT